MRLSEHEIETINKLARFHFGKDVEVILFGSRTNDKKKGGDIDLFVTKKSKDKPAQLSKINFLVDLMMDIGEQKVDVVLDSEEIRKSGFYQTINQTGIKICQPMS